MYLVAATDQCADMWEIPRLIINTLDRRMGAKLGKLLRAAAEVLCHAKMVHEGSAIVRCCRELIESAPAGFIMVIILVSKAINCLSQRVMKYVRGTA